LTSTRIKSGIKSGIKYGGASGTAYRPEGHLPESQHFGGMRSTGDLADGRQPTGHHTPHDRVIPLSPAWHGGE
jgi:hypothetical protein